METAMNIVLSAIINSDQTKYEDRPDGYFIMGGGTAKPADFDPEVGFNVREIGLKPVGAATGDVTAPQWIFPGGLVLVAPGGASASLTGKRVTITIEEDTP